MGSEFGRRSSDAKTLKCEPLFLRFLSLKTYFSHQFFSLIGLWSLSAAKAGDDRQLRRVKRQAQAPTDTGPPTKPSRINILSRNRQVGNARFSFVTWGDRISLSSFSEETWPYVVLNFYYRLSATDKVRRPLNIHCWKANSLSNLI